MAPPPKITLAALGGGAAALALQRLRRKWLALPYAWRRSATRAELMRWILFDAAPEWATTERMHALRRAVACPAQSVSYANADPLLIVGGQGARLVDVRGRRFLDTRNNVAHVGHAHPRVAGAVAAAMTAPCTNTRYLHPNHAALCKRLLETMPAPLDRGHVFLVNSGSEANDLALRLCRAACATAPRRRLRRRRAHARLPRPHGGLHRPVALQARHATFNGRGRPPWVEVADAPDAYRGGGRADAVEAACARLEERGIRVGALFVESGASVAGVRLPPEGFLSKAFEAVRRRGGIVVADEVQTGLGRLGSSWYAFEAHGVAPDVVTVGKPFGNGLPLAAAVVARAVSDAFAAGPEYFNTFGGNPACCAAGLAVLEAIEADGLRANATRVGAELRKGFERLMGLGGARCVVGDVRGRGLFLGVDLVTDAASKAPATAEASWICARLVTRHRILTSLDGPGDNVLVVKPPLCFSLSDAAEFLAALEEGLVAANALALRGCRGGITCADRYPEVPHEKTRS